MAMSGIEVVEEIPTLYNSIKMKQTHKWATFKIEKKKRIIVDEVADPKTTETKEDDRACFEELKEAVTGNEEPRYILYDFGFKNKEGRKLQKLAFIFWCPDNGPIGLKMIYASSKDTIKKSFTGVGLEFQANDEADFDYKDFSDEVERKA